MNAERHVLSEDRDRAIRLLEGDCRKPYDQYDSLDQQRIDRVVLRLAELSARDDA